MKKIIRELFFSLLFGALLAAIVIFLSVEAFAYKVPGIEEPCGYTAGELEAVLKGELKQYAQEFIWAEEDYGINACFLAAVASLESGHGEHMFRKNNVFGFGRAEFDSVPECIDYVAWYIRKHYLNPEGKYYRGGTIEDIGRIWCPDGGEWARLVRGIFREMVNVEELEGLTMDVKEKLVELLGNNYLPMMDGPNTIGEYTIPHKFKEKIADYLISNGVTVQECAYWQYIEDDIDEDNNIQAYCSVCGAGDKHATSMIGKVLYCWNCGRKMMTQPPKGE